jgi:hypothetical protein
MNRRHKLYRLAGALLLPLAMGGFLSLNQPPGPESALPLGGSADWPEYHGGPERNHYSVLRQIGPANVARLEKVWEYASGGADTATNQTQIQCNPVVVDGVLYGVLEGRPGETNLLCLRTPALCPRCRHW